MRAGMDMCVNEIVTCFFFWFFCVNDTLRVLSGISFGYFGLDWTSFVPEYTHPVAVTV